MPLLQARGCYFQWLDFSNFQSTFYSPCFLWELRMLIALQDWTQSFKIPKVFGMLLLYLLYKYSCILFFSTSVIKISTGMFHFLFMKRRRSIYLTLAPIAEGPPYLCQSGEDPPFSPPFALYLVLKTPRHGHLPSRHLTDFPSDRIHVWCVYSSTQQNCCLIG